MFSLKQKIYSIKRNYQGYFPPSYNKLNRHSQQFGEHAEKFLLGPHLFPAESFCAISFLNKSCKKNYFQNKGRDKESFILCYSRFPKIFFNLLTPINTLIENKYLNEVF